LHVERPQESVQAILEFARTRGVEAPSDALVKLDRYVDSLLRWNEKHNLISRSDTASVWTKHVLHSIGVLVSIQMSDEAVFADIGTGGGFPGIPVAIFKPRSRGFLIESISKKAEAVKAIAREAGVTNVTIVHSRAEDPLTVKRLRRSCDLVFSRAVAPLTKLAGWSAPLLKPFPVDSNGAPTPSMIALKGGDITDEVRALHSRYPNADIRIAEMEFDEAIGLVGKKVVTVKFPGTT